MSLPSPLLLATAAAFGWALYDLARRSLAARLSAWSLVVGLTTGAVPPLLAWALWIGDWRVEAPYWAPSLASVALNVVANFCFFRSFQLAPLSVSLPMLSFTPLFASLLGALFLGESLGPAGALGALLVVGGGLALGLKEGGLQIEKGSVLMLAVAFLWSATLLLDKRALLFASPHLHALVLNAGVALGGLAYLAIARRARELADTPRETPRLAIAVLIGAAALVVQLVALREAPLGVIETLKRGVGGLAAVVFGALLYGESFTLRKLLAVAVMTAGVALILR